MLLHDAQSHQDSPKHREANLGDQGTISSFTECSQSGVISIDLVSAQPGPALRPFPQRGFRIEKRLGRAGFPLLQKDRRQLPQGKFGKGPGSKALLVSGGQGATLHQSSQIVVSWGSGAQLYPTAGYDSGLLGMLAEGREQLGFVRWVRGGLTACASFSVSASPWPSGEGRGCGLPDP